MKYALKTDGVEFQVSKRPAPKTDRDGVQKKEVKSNLPLWVVELTTWTNEEDGSDVLVVNVAAPMPPVVAWRETVEVVGLEIRPWAMKSDSGDLRSGVAFHAEAIRPAHGGKSGK